jgi:ABC-type uncharacterized transport system permease subunit
MFELPIPEMVVFIVVVAVYFAAALVGILQLFTNGEKCRRFLLPLVSLAVTLEAVLLILRAVELKAVPLTGLFESMIVLTIVFGLIFLFLSIAIEQVWFGSVMVWAVFALIAMTGVVARPASEPHKIAATPWAIAHGIAMILGGASITFAAANAIIYLLGKRRLKQKKVMQVFGRIPNLEKLELMTVFGIKAGFVLITIGMISGVGLIWLLGTGITDWLTDGKVTPIIGAWVLLLVSLVFNRQLLHSGKIRAYITIVVFVLILFAILGTALLGTTQHDFSGVSSVGLGQQ